MRRSACVERNSAHEWETVSDDDLAVFSVTLGRDVQWWAIPTSTFITREFTRRGFAGLPPIGPGDEVAVIGRFVSHEGQQRNKPTVRFGNIAMDADEQEKIRIAEGVEQEAFLVECRIGPLLLGVDCAHIPTWTNVRERRDTSSVYRDANGPLWVDMHSGIAAVIPAWRLAAVLNSERLVAERHKEDAALVERLVRKGNNQ